MKLVPALIIAGLVTGRFIDGSPQDEDAYQLMGCNSTLVASNTQTGLRTVPNRNIGGQACMCGFLKDALPAETKMTSVRTATPCINGYAVTSDQKYECSNIDLMSFVGLKELNAVDGKATDKTNDVWGWTDPETCREIAILGMASGTAFVDVTDPTNNVYLGKLPAHGGVSSDWRGIKTYKNHAFIVSEYGKHGMQIFDLTQLSGLSGNPKNFTETYHYNGMGNTHTIFINEDTGFAYAVGTNQCRGGLHMIDISIPSAPKFAGCFSDDGYTHEVQCVVYHGNDKRYTGREICFGCNTDTVTIIDVTDKKLPVQLSRTSYSNVGYTHQGWLSDDHNHFVFGDELDERNSNIKTRTLVLNLGRNLQRPRMGGSYLSKTNVIDHNQYVIGDRIYQANYQAGLRILKINNFAMAKFTEIGYFDIFPASNKPEFNGAWSNYPFFPSGTVVVSGIEQGLFVFRPTVVTCPDTDRCDGSSSSSNIFDSTTSQQCSLASDQKYSMRKRYFVSFFCTDQCVSNLSIQDKLESGWECGRCAD